MIGSLPSLPARWLAQIRWRALSFVHHFFEGDGEWGGYRLAAALAAVVLWLAFGRLTESLAASPWVDQLSAAAVPFMQPVIRFAAGFFTREALRHALLPAAGFLLAVRVGAAFINDLFELGNFSLANDYLTASLFGQNYPKLAIKDGKAEPGSPDNPLIKIGGPGIVNLGIGMAAVFEHVAGPSSIVGPGKHFIRRFEALREVFDLRDHYRVMPEVKAMTKDGIPVTVKDVQMSFRLRTGKGTRTEAEPYPYSVAALREAAYNRTVGEKGASPWVDSVAGAVAGQIRGMIGARRLDDLIASPSRDPRDEMHAEFDRPGARKKFAGLGAEILWVSLGHFETPSPVATQRILTWKARWQTLVNVTEAHAQAERLWQKEIAHGESKLHRLNLAGREADSEAAHDLFFIQLADTLEAYTLTGAAPGKTQLTDILRQTQRMRTRDEDDDETESQTAGIGQP